MLARPATPGGVALAVLDRPEAASRILSAAANFLRLGEGGRVNALALTPESGAALLPTEEVMTAERRKESPAQVRSQARALRAAFDRWTAQARDLGAEWTEVEGDPAAAVAERGAHADIAVLRRPGDRGDDTAREALHAALFEAGCPVLLLPPETRGNAAAPVVAIAWRDDPHARKAVQSALPLLRRARRVVALCGGASQAPLPPPPALLSAQGIRAEVARVAPGGDSTGAALLVEARRIGADLLVMGAFAHGEFRERLLGGVTAQVLAAADLPVLMQH
ncbi:MAG TPA: universal stress protein [Roseomonas sp.]|nr:universal stress protein [Roseomonas sp.]